MKIDYRVLMLLLLSLSVSTAIAAPKLTDYPLRVRIFHEHWGTEYYEGGWGSVYPGGYHGYGEANVIDGDHINGMKFTFECSDHFTANDSDESYPAKWRKQGQEIEMIGQMIGSNSVHKCIMKTTLKDTVYYRHNGELMLLSQEQFKQRQIKAAEYDSSIAPQDRDVMHYPLQLTILGVNWRGRVSGIWTGQGQGNVTTANGLQAVDFSISCVSDIAVNPVGRYYRGKWTEEGSTAKMTLLLHKMNDQSAAVNCQLTTSLHPDVYIRRSTGDLQAVSPEEYKNFERAVVAAPSQAQ
jgi:hypothetical protein